MEIVFIWEGRFYFVFARDEHLTAISSFFFNSLLRKRTDANNGSEQAQELVAVG
jgi:hypothetical protein